MPEVADLTIGGEYQNMLVQEGEKVYMEALTFDLKALMQDGYLAGTYLPRGDAKVSKAMLRVERLRAKAMMEGLTPREQKALQESLDILEEADAEQATA